MPAPRGNSYAMKWPTSSERKKLFRSFCKHLAEGFSIDSFPLADRKTIRRYAQEFPEDFPPEKLDEAARKGLLVWERMGKRGANGELSGFNATAWIFNMKNRAGWKDRTEVEAWGILGGPDDAKKLEQMKPRSAEEIALGVMALLTSGDASDNGDGTGSAD